LYISHVTNVYFLVFKNCCGFVRCEPQGHVPQKPDPTYATGYRGNTEIGRESLNANDKNNKNT